METLAARGQEFNVSKGLKKWSAQRIERLVIHRRLHFFIFTKQTNMCFVVVAETAFKPSNVLFDKEHSP
jgi:hypothetical protein